MYRKIISSVLLAGAMQAQTFNVSTAQELADALNSAAMNGKDDTIILSAGTYQANSSVQFQYLASESNSLTLRAADGLDRSDVVIDGGRIGTTLYLENTVSAPATRLERLTIQNGYTPHNGGGVYSTLPLVVERCEISHNKAVENGGGLYATGYADINDTLVKDNNVTGYSYTGGGGLFVNTPLEDRNTTIIFSRFENNGVIPVTDFLSSYIYGGAISNTSSGTSSLLIQHSSFIRNHIKGDEYSNGGAIYANTVYVFDSNFTKNSAGPGGEYRSGAKGGALLVKEYLVVSKVRFEDNSAVYGGAISTSSDAKTNISESTFISNSAHYNGGAISSDGTLKVEKSDFISNSCGYDSYYVNTQAGGAVYVLGSVELKECTFKSNKVLHGDGGAVYANTPLVIRSTFYGNSASREGGAVYADTQLLSVNSVYEHNHAPRGSEIAGRQYGKSFIANNTFRANATDANTTVAVGQGVLINNIFYDANQNDGIDLDRILANGDLKLYNNYVSNTHILNPEHYLLVRSGSLAPSTNSVKFDGNSSRLLSSSDLIDRGLDPLSTTFKLLLNYAMKDFHSNDDMGKRISKAILTDKDGNRRVAGSGTDIGAYEYGSTNAIPIINDINISGDLYDGETINVSVGYLIDANRTLDTLLFDYESNGTFTNLSSHVYQKAGSYILTIKVVDDIGDYTTATKRVLITKKPFDLLDDESKLKKAINPAYYDEIMSIIKKQKENSYSLGVDNVKNYLADYNLTTVAKLQEAIANARKTAIEDVKNHPKDYNITMAVKVDANSVDNLAKGWHMVGIPVEISDMYTFDGAKVIWYYHNGEWSGYSSDTTIQQHIINAGLSKCSILPQNSAVWIYK